MDRRIFLKLAAASGLATSLGGVHAVEAWGAPPVFGAVPLHPSKTLVLRGIDRTVDPAVLLAVEIAPGSGLFASADNGQTWTANLGLPPASKTSVTKIVRFGDALYAGGRSLTTNLWSLWRAVPGQIPLNWVGPVLQIADPRASIKTTAFNEGNGWLYVGEYGDPPPPGHSTTRVYRSETGTSFEECFSYVATHNHCVNPDPFSPGDVYVTCGDGPKVSRVYRSSAFGAPGTWSEIDAGKQVVQVSFDADRVWFAGDDATERHPGTTAFHLPRGSTGLQQAYVGPSHWQIPNPLNPRKYFYKNSYYGLVDPSTKRFYCVAVNGPQNVSGYRTQGVFRIGDPTSSVELLAFGFPDSGDINLGWEVFINPPLLFAGQYSVPLG